MNPFEYIKQRITDIADVNVAINGRDPSWGYADLMELLANIEEAYNDRYGSSDTISRRAAIDAILAQSIHESIRDLYEYTQEHPTAHWAEGLCDAIDAVIAVDGAPSAQPEKTDNDEFWRERANYYYEMCMSLISKMGEGVKVGSIKIDESGITFFEKEPEPYTERWRRMSRLDDAISDVAYILDSLMVLRNIYESGSCNDCKGVNGCRYNPKPGQLVRYNCPFYKRRENESG